MADVRDLQLAISATEEEVRQALGSAAPHALIRSNLAIARAIQEAGVRVELASYNIAKELR